MAFAATVYLARTLGAASYGIIGLATAVLLYFAYLADCGVETLGIREIAADHARVRTLAPQVLAARTLLALSLWVLLALVGLLVLPQPEGAVLGVYGLTLLAVAANTRWVHLGLERARAVALARMAGESLMLTLVILLVHRPAEVARVPLAQFSGDMLAALLLAWGIRRRWGSLRLSREWAAARDLFRRSWTLVLHALLGLLIYNSDLIFLRIFRDSASVGHYAAAYTLISLLLNLGIAYSQSLLPALTRLQGTEEQRRLYHTAMAQVFAAAFPVAVGACLLAGPIMGLVFGAGFGPSALALQVLAWSIPLAFFRNVPQMALIAAGRQALVLMITAGAAALNFGLNLLIIPRYGMVGAAVATVATEAVRTLLAVRHAGTVGYGVTRLARFWRALLAGSVMGVVLLLVRPGALWVAVPVGAAIYTAGLVATGGLRFRRGALPALTV